MSAALLVYRRPRSREVTAASTQILPYHEETEDREDRPSEEDIHVLRTSGGILIFADQHPGKRHKRSGTYLLRSIHPITSRLSPSVFAASSNRRCVPFSTFRWSTRSSRTARPCAMNSSRRESVFWMKPCSWRACCSRRPPFMGMGVGPRNGDSDTSSAADWFGINRRRASPGADKGTVEEDAPESNSARDAVSCWKHGLLEYT